MAPTRLFPRMLASVLLALATTAAAGSAAVRDTGAYAVHYNALPSNRLDAELAARHELPHSKDRSVVTVAVLRRAGGKPVPAMVRGHATGPDGRMHNLRMREIREATAVYYVAVLDSAPRLEFTLEVRPPGGMPPETIRFSRQFASAEPAPSAGQTDQGTANERE